MTGIILAGGKNSRMGAKKAFLKFGEATIIDNLLSIYKRIFSEIIIVTNTPEDYEYTGAKLVKDIIPGKGPLGGIYTGLLSAKFEYSFISACDMPFIKEDIIRYISAIEGFDIAVPVIDGHYEPLFALYSKNCIPVLKEQLEAVRLSVKDVFKCLNVKELDAEKLWKYSASVSFTNVNTPEDVSKALSFRQNQTKLNKN